MIDITIKTLDSRNHVFSVEDELTVKELKEQIAEPVNIPADSQRLIYCGRVLVDEKKLSEYDVNGKVIHLVQRAPPSGNQQESSSSSSNEPRGATYRRGSIRTIFSPGGRLSAMDGAGGGNAMYLGAMAFPADLMDAQGISMPQPRHRLSQSRLSVARAMLRRARYTLLNLENPTHQESPQEMNSNNDDSLSAFAEAVAGLAERNNVGVQHPPPHINIEEVNGDSDMQAEEAEPTPEANSPEDSPSGEESTSNANGDSNDNTRNGRYRFPGPIHMAELIFFVREIERRLSPFLERFYDLVRRDPVLENPAESQRLFDQVSKMMHFLAHAYHAISDIMCDFSQPPPRRLRCRPVLIQHSAVLQTGIPIQQVSLGGSGSSSNGNSSGTGSNAQTNQRTSNTNDSATEAAPAAEVSSTSTSTTAEANSTEETPPRRFNFSPSSGGFFNIPSQRDSANSSSPPGIELSSDDVNDLENEFEDGYAVYVFCNRTDSDEE